MDIPSSSNGRNTYTSSEAKQPARPGGSSAVNQAYPGTSSPIILTSANLASSADELNITPNQRVIAVVVASINDGDIELGKELSITREGRLVDSKQTANAPLGNETVQAKTTTNSQASSAPPTEAISKTGTREWLLLIDSKFLLVETNSDIKPNSTIQIYTDSQGALKLAGTHIPQSTSDTDLLRSAISKILPQQVSIESGIQQLIQRADQPLTPVLTSPETPLKQQTEAFIAAAALKVLTSNLTDLSLLGPQQSAVQALPIEPLLSRLLSAAQLETLSTSSAQIQAPLKDSADIALNKPSAFGEQIRRWLSSSGMNYERQVINMQRAAQNLASTTLLSATGETKTEASLTSAQNSTTNPLILNTSTISATSKHELFTAVVELMMRTIDSPASSKGNDSGNFEVSKQSLSLLTETFKIVGIDYQPKLLSHENLQSVTRPEALLHSAPFTSAVSQLRQTINALESAQTLLHKAVTSIAQNNQPPVSAEVVKQLAPLVSQIQTLDTLVLKQQTSLIQFLQTQVSTDYKHPASDVTLNHPHLLTTLALAAPAPSSDLKETLMQLTGAIQSLGIKGVEGLLPRTTSKEDIPPLRGLSESALLFRPFDFPQLKQDIAKVQASLSDQELSTGQVLKLLAGMLNRINFNQLNSLYQAQSGADPNLTQSWHFELPFIQDQQTHVASLRIDKEQQNSGKDKDGKEANKDPKWKISLSFNFEDLGPIFIEASLVPPKIYSKIWAENTQTQQLINQEKGQFAKQLEDLGLTVEEILCFHGKPTKARTTVARGLVDIKA